MSAILRTALFRSLSKNNYLHYSYNEQLLASIKRINLPLQNVGVRLLFTQEILAIDKYLDARNKITAQFGDMRKGFFERMNNYVNDDNSLIFTEDLKNALYLVEDDENELLIVEKMLNKFQMQNSTLRFGTFVFGPVVLRMIHHLKKPDLGIQLVKDSNFHTFFNQLSSMTLILDLLFKQERYQDILDLFNYMRQNYPLETKYPRDALLLVMGACYKLNTKESFNYAFETLKRAKEMGSQVTRKAVCLFAALAIKQNQPNLALEVLSMALQSNYITVRNLRLIALAETGRFQDVFNGIMMIINSDLPSYENRGPILSETFEKIKQLVEQSNDKELKQNFSQFEKGLKDGNHIQDQSLDTLLLIPVKPAENFGRDPRPPFNRNQAFQSIKPRIQRHREGLRGMDVE